MSELLAKRWKIFHLYEFCVCVDICRQKRHRSLWASDAVHQVTDLVDLRLKLDILADVTWMWCPSKSFFICIFVCFPSASEFAHTWSYSLASLLTVWLSLSACSPYDEPTLRDWFCVDKKLFVTTSIFTNRHLTGVAPAAGVHLSLLDVFIVTYDRWSWQRHRQHQE